MHNIQITLPEVSALAKEMRVLNEQMREVLENTKQQMNALAGVWQSQGAEEIRARFQHFSLRLQQEYDTIERYAKFLDHTVASYDSLESTIKANASTFN